jgi:hypothetical protein
LEDRIADLLVTPELDGGGEVTVDVENGTLAVRVHHNARLPWAA